MHFAGSIIVPESVENPLKYYRNNTLSTLNLIGAALDAGVSHFIFSSTAAVYGIPERSPVDEDAPARPINPYGSSKLMSEQMLRDAAAANPTFRPIALRYFNVAGADPDGRAGQQGPNTTHLVRAAVEVALGVRPVLDLWHRLSTARRHVRARLHPRHRPRGGACLGTSLPRRRRARRRH